jgi:hypothetical protein
MANFRIRMKVQGFELEVDGEREDIPAITNAVKDQLGGFVISGDVVTDGRKQLEATNRGTTDDDKGGRRRNRNAGRSSEAAAAAIEFRHDAAKYGNPIQDWIAAQKCICFFL